MNSIRVYWIETVAGESWTQLEYKILLETIKGLVFLVENGSDGFSLRDYRDLEETTLANANRILDVGVGNSFATYEDAFNAMTELKTLGDEWAAADYRIRSRPKSEV